MEEVKTVKKTFKPLFIYQDKANLNRITQHYRDSVNNLNALMAEAEKALSRKLTEDEAQTIAAGSSAFFEEIKGKFPFPNATEFFNYEAMGLDIESLKSKAAAYKGSTHSYTLKDGIFSESKRHLAILAKKADVFTTNEKQNTALKASEKMLEAFRTIIDNGLVSNPSMGLNRVEASNFIKVNEKGQMVIFHQKILSL